MKRTQTQTWGMPMNPQCVMWPVANVAVVVEEKVVPITRIVPPTPPPKKKEWHKC